jgi:hypothetical protein
VGFPIDFKNLALLIGLTLPIGAMAAAPTGGLHTDAPREKRPSPTICERRTRYLRNTYESKITASDVLDRALTSGKKIIVFGESHFERSKKFYYSAFRELKTRNPNLDCLLVEQPKEKYQKGLDQCFKIRNCKNIDLPDFSGVLQGLAIGYKVKAIDAVTNFFSLPEDLLADVTRRDHFMADTTEALFTSGECHAAIMVVGSAHMRGQERETSLAALLKEKNLDTYRIELLSPGEDRNGCSDQRWRWQAANKAQICTEEMPSLKENFAFVNSKDGEGVPSQYGDIPGMDKTRRTFGNWGDYDAAVALGCDDPNLSSCPEQEIPDCNR